MTDENNTEIDSQEPTLYNAVEKTVAAFEVVDFFRQKSQDVDSSVGQLFVLKGEFFDVEVSQDFVSRNSPAIGGFCVMEEDGTLSFMTKEDFESAFVQAQ